MADHLSRKLEDLTCKENLPPQLNESRGTFANLEIERRELLDAIQNYVGDDPLKPWVRYIKWAKDLYSSGVKSEILPVLESCTQRFLDDTRYVNDLRYLRIWIRYADCCSDPLEVFQFLESKAIGQSHSLYYEAYAVILEVRGDLVKADEMYQLGISREAQPTEQLQSMYKSFLKRKAKVRATHAKEKQPLPPAVVLEHKGRSSHQVPQKTQSLDAQLQQGTKFGSTRPVPSHDLQRKTQQSDYHETKLGSTCQVPLESSQPATQNSEGQLQYGTKMAVTRKVPLGDETIAIKRYAEEAIVLGVDPEAANMDLERHRGLVDPTINTKEAMENVLSLFNQPLPLEQPKKPRTNSSKRAVPSSGAFQVYVDEAFAGESSGKSTSPAFNFPVFEDENMDRKQESFPVFNDMVESSNQQSFRIFSDDGYTEREKGLSFNDQTSLDVFADDDMSRNIPKQQSFPSNENIQSNFSQQGTSFQVFRDDDMSCSNPEHVEDRPQVEKEDAGCSNRLNPWDEAMISELLKSIKPPLSTYKGFHSSNKKYPGNLKGNMRNKTIDLGNRTYHLKGCTGQGAFAQVYQAEDNSHDETVVLKIQKPPCPWEFYMYCQLDKRIPQEERKSFGHAWKMHVFQDCSIMVADYGQHGTLQDVINSYLAHGQKMDELLCMYYTIEMLRMLEILHSEDIIHGDFKPDNLLIRNDSDNWGDWGPDRPGGWKHQGLCLIDWGKSIDMSLFPPGTEFSGDSNTSSFRCVEMVQGRPWTYQVDTYGLCGIIHCMLHGTYMEIQQERSFGGHIFRPRSPLKRYWNTSVWDKLFKTLLNVRSCDANPPLAPLRVMLEKYLLSNASYAIRLKELLMKQTLMLYAPRR